MKDPNPAVSGKGLAALRRGGLEVAAGLLEEEASALNRPYCRWVVSGKPYVTLKLAMSLDGQIASYTGASRWISGEESRNMVHRMRAEVDAVLVGGGTLRKDDPLLSSRIRGGRDPRRIVITSRLSGISGRRLFREGRGRILFVCPRGVSDREVERVTSLGGRVLRLPARGGRIPADDFLRALGKEGVTSLLVEGGGRTAGWLVSAGAVDRFVFFLAPLLLGEGIRAVAGFRSRTVAEGRKLEIKDFRRIGEDLVVTAEALRETGE
jgi:diaminohydroxyphosphoribosylaminopyrimidine deaminase/5-amino-6-(5-phosphoribosylamino)uracil reductase